MALQEEFKSQGDVLFTYRGTIPIIFLVIGLGEFEVEWNFWVIAALVTGGIYLTLKIIKKRTKLLNEIER